jgi:hypothetical protein
MLDSSTITKRAKRRRLRAASTRRYRQHQRDGVVVVLVEIDRAVCDLLVRTRAASEVDLLDRAKLGQAVSRLLKASALATMKDTIRLTVTR